MYAFSVNGQVTAAVVARAPEVAILPVDVATVGLILSAPANVAAEVVAIVPNASSSNTRPTGFGVSLASQPPGIEHTVFVPATPEYAAMLVYVFLVTAAGMTYSSSA